MRELPRLDDGLRDVERRLLRALDRLGAPARFVKSARVLTQASDVPTDARPLEELLTARRPWRATRDPLLSAYATLVDMAVPFRTRIPLVEGRGNFGTQHGDPPADHMYTECRLSPWGAAVLGGAPNLLVNGARADASRVFHFLPHNLGEVVDALVECVQSARPRTLVPDLPCGAVVDEAELEALAHTGQGKLRVRARMRQENVDGVPLVVLTEAPQDVDLEEIILGASKAIRAGLVRSVRDLRDESTREGLRIVFVGERGANPDEIEAALHAHTCSTIEVDGMALCDGTERCMSTADLLKETARRLSSRPAMVEELRALAAAHTTPRRTSTARFA